MAPALAGRFFTTEPLGKPKLSYFLGKKKIVRILLFVLFHDPQSIFPIFDNGWHIYNFNTLEEDYAEGFAELCSAHEGNFPFFD